MKTICFIAMPLIETDLINIQEEFFKSFYSVKYSIFLKAGIKINDVEKICYQEIGILSLIAYLKKYKINVDVLYIDLKNKKNTSPRTTCG